MNNKTKKIINSLIDDLVTSEIELVKKPGSLFWQGKKKNARELINEVLETSSEVIHSVSDSLIFKDLTTLTITQSSEYLMFDIRDGNVTNTKYLNKEQTKKLKDFLNYR